jgi:hypothetical protein
VRADRLVEAFGLPEESRVDRRLPKASIAERGATTSRDRHLVKDGVEQVIWVAALKPSTVSIAPYRDEEREYLEIAVVHAVLRGNSRSDRIFSIIHRSIPYPVALVTETPSSIGLSFANKRWSKHQSEVVVLDGDVVTRSFDRGEVPFCESLLEALDVSWHTEASFFDLYQRWIDVVAASLAAVFTGRFEPIRDPQRRARRMDALRHYRRLESEAGRLKTAAARERQISRRVTLNHELKRLENEMQELHGQL